jgi:hypothetical protein
MIQSRYILDILDLILDDSELPDSLKRQIPFLTEIKREHTGVGVFIYFANNPGIEEGNVKVSQSTDFVKNPSKILNGVEIKSVQLNILAEAIAHLKGDIVECLEIFNMNGEDYPLNDPENYELSQIWNQSKKRKIIR